MHLGSPVYCLAWLEPRSSTKPCVNMHRRIFALNVTTKTQTVFAGMANLPGNQDGPALSAQIVTGSSSALAVNPMTGDVSAQHCRALSTACDSCAQASKSDFPLRMRDLHGTAIWAHACGTMRSCVVCLQVYLASSGATMCMVRRIYTNGTGTFVETLSGTAGCGSAASGAYLHGPHRSSHLTNARTIALDSITHAHTSLPRARHAGSVSFSAATFGAYGLTCASMTPDNTGLLVCDSANQVVRLLNFTTQTVTVVAGMCDECLPQ